MKLKIRAFDESSGEFAYSNNVEQDYYFWGFDRDGEVACYYEVEKLGNSEFDPPEIVMEEVSGPYELWTGLLNKEGEKIFEGDIVRIKYYKEDKGAEFSIIFNETMFILKFCNGSGEFSPLGDEIDFIEKIGDIHQNPELLESKD